MTNDFRDGTSFPSRGRKRLGPFLRLARVSDKANANAQKTLGDYIYPCPIDCGMIERWGLTVGDFESAVAAHGDHESLLRWALSQVSRKQIDTANAWLLHWTENLERQDREERSLSEPTYSG